jgi:hypothetical protein
LVVTYSGIPKDLAGPGLAHALHVALLVLDIPQGVRDNLQARKSSKHLLKNAPNSVLSKKYAKHALHVALLVLDVPQGVGDYLQARKSPNIFFVKKNPPNSVLSKKMRETIRHFTVSDKKTVSFLPTL